MTTGRRSVLIAGLPRSGTTWTAEALGRCRATMLVHEPDNDRNRVEALAAKARLGRFPILAAGEPASAYAALWALAFTGTAEAGGARNRWAAAQVAAVPESAVDRVMADPSVRWPLRLRAARWAATSSGPGGGSSGPVVVKSVHCALALDWMANTVATDAVAVVVRHPANVIGSWRDMGWGMRGLPWHDPRLWARFGPPGGAHPGPGAPEQWITRAAWQYALMASALLAAADAHGWTVVDHGALLDAPARRLADLAGELGLTWSDDARAWVEASDRPGEGYDLGRRAAEERERWRHRLEPTDRAAVADVLGRFPALGDRWPLAPGD